MHTVKKELRLYRVQVNWNHSSPEHNEKSHMPTNLAVKHLISIQDCGPRPLLADLGSNYMINPPAEALLSNLELIPPNPFTSQNNRKLPAILAAFTCALPDGEYPESEPAARYYTVFRRWEIHTQEVTLPSGFDHVSKKPHGDQTSEAQVSVACEFRPRFYL